MYGNDDDNYSQLIDDEVSQYEFRIKNQQKLFINSLNESIKNFIKTRIAMDNEFYNSPDKSAYKNLYGELYKLSLKTLSDHFGVRVLS